MPLPAPGAPPAAPPGPPGGTGGATAPGPMMGNQAQGMAAVKVAMEALQKALPGIPMGSELHNEVLTALSKIGKHMQHPGGGGQDVIQQLVGMAREQHADPAKEQALAGMMGGGAPPPPGAGAPPPQMGA